MTRAAHRGRTGVVRLLLAAGAGVDVPTRKGNSPLAVAAREGALDIVRMLVGAGASINRVNLAQMDEPCARLSNRNREDMCEPRPGTALMQAAQGGRTETMRVLLDLGADVHGVDLGGNSALSWVAKGGDMEAAKLLLARGADVNHQDNSGFTSLMWAAFNAQLGLAQLLCDRGADVDVRDFLSGRNALIWAAGKGLFDIAELLVDRGTNVHAKDTQGNSALTVAISGKRTSVRNLLYEAGAMVMLGEDCVSLELLSALSHFQSMGDQIRRTVLQGTANDTSGASLLEEEGEGEKSSICLWI